MKYLFIYLSLFLVFGCFSLSGAGDVLCKFPTNDPNYFYDLCPLALKGTLRASFKTSDDAYDVLFAIGNYAKECNKYMEKSGTRNLDYLACQWYSEKTIYKIGDPFNLSRTVNLNGNGILLQYDSDIYHLGCVRKTILSLICSPSTEFRVTKTSSPGTCLYQIDIESKYACRKRK
ncbi:hypothetical protein CYY_003294 [Polysphondylium violaceum]|uniref:MRH domain-containing protein n=1 Tax=Polysphondylium violaceum TaxID=133409 RepID=A0A8J4PWZ4_9MYCE|nr:hypothetical protein CYY_003294 [Polysphondylium violaceum]